MSSKKYAYKIKIDKVLSEYLRVTLQLSVDKKLQNVFSLFRCFTKISNK